MDEDNLSKNLPPDTSEFFRSIWHSLSPSDRTALLNLIKGLPDRTKPLKSLLKLGASQLKYSFGQKNHIVIIGPTNVGKSTLYNQFVLNKNDHAEVSPVPGTTRNKQISDAGLFSIIDTPGVDAVGVGWEKEQNIALESASEADFLVIMFDAIQGIKQKEIYLYRQLLKLKKPYIVVLNKMDLAGSKRKEVIEYSAKMLNLDETQIVPIAAKNGENLQHIVAAIVMTDPTMVSAMGRAFPQYRWKLAWRTITNSASLSAAIALTPLPIVDFIPLVIAQSLMVVGVARIYDYRITPKRARELIATFGMGFIGRSLFYEISKFGGIPGWVVSVAIASSTTVAMGYAAAIWFERGERLSGEALKKITSAVNQQILDQLHNIGKKKPGKKILQSQLRETLEHPNIDQVETTIIYDK